MSKKGTHDEPEGTHVRKHSGPTLFDTLACLLKRPFKGHSRATLQKDTLLLIKHSGVAFLCDALIGSCRAPS